MPHEARHMRRPVVAALRELDAFAVENSAYPGTPDVYFLHGWIELKECDDWPKRPTTPLRLPHFTKHQRAWIKRHSHRGGTVFVLLKVGKKEWFLIDGEIAADTLGSSTRAEIESIARLVFHNGLDSEELLRCLKLTI
jgi:hypothetical protein